MKTFRCEIWTKNEMGKWKNQSIKFETVSSKVEKICQDLAKALFDNELPKIKSTSIRLTIQKISR